MKTGLYCSDDASSHYLITASMFLFVGKDCAVLLRKYVYCSCPERLLSSVDCGCSAASMSTMEQLVRLIGGKLFWSAD
jgi:predicted nucleic acid-binding Zn finger protein